MSNRSIFIITGNPSRDKAFFTQVIAQYITKASGIKRPPFGFSDQYEIQHAIIECVDRVVIIEQIGAHLLDAKNGAEIIGKCFNRPQYAPVIIAINDEFENINPYLLTQSQSFLERVVIYKTFYDENGKFRFKVI